MIDGQYTIDEAREWLGARGFIRSKVWYQIMIKKKKIVSSLLIGRRVISPLELKRILKKKPHLTVTVS